MYDDFCNKSEHCKMSDDQRGVSLALAFTLDLSL
jgi:hypothetical protein